MKGNQQKEKEKDSIREAVRKEKREWDEKRTKMQRDGAFGRKLRRREKEVK